MTPSFPSTTIPSPPSYDFSSHAFKLKNSENGICQKFVKMK